MPPGRPENTTSLHKQTLIVRSHPTSPKGRLFWLVSHLAVVDNTNVRLAPLTILERAGQQHQPHAQCVTGL